MVGGVAAALIVALIIGLTCTFCACCRRCGGGCRARRAAGDNDSNDSSSTYAEAASQTAVSEMSKRSFRRKRSTPYRSRRSPQDGSTAATTTATSFTDASSFTNSVSDATALDDSFFSSAFASTSYKTESDESSSSEDWTSVSEGGDDGDNTHGAFDGAHVQGYGSLQTLPGDQCEDSLCGGQHASLHEADVSANLGEPEDLFDGFARHEDPPDAACLSQMDRSMLTEANVHHLHGDDEAARLRAVGSIRYHQSQGMSEDESVLLHLYRHRATSDPAFGTFVEVNDDVMSD